MSKFNKEELDIVEEVNSKISDLFPLILNNQLDDFLTKFAIS